MNKKENIIEAYNKFTALFEEDKYYSESEFHHWSQEYHEFKDDIYSYRGLIDRINRYAKSFKVPGAIVDSYVNLFLAPKDYAPAIDYLFNVYENGIQVIHTRNEGWIEKELEHNQRFFDNLDGNKLTLNQRKAILIDEANNLVVSGADRGLTIVGKVGYIIRSKLAAPQEILVLAYNDQARERLQERLKRICEVQINVQTFHGYGSEVLEKACGAKPMLSELASGDFLRRTLQSFLDERIKELKYTNLLNKYFFYYLDPVENSLEISTQSEYDEYLGTIQIRTLKGETVESLAELELANFLYVNGVNYEYKKKYEAGSPSETGPYTPDFCLPDSNIWIEHIDIDRDGNPAPGVDRTEYLDSWQRKRKTHQENSTELLETYGYQHTEGTLIENLVSQLEVRGVKINKIPVEQVFESLRTLGDASQFIGLLAKFLRLFRSSTYTISDLRREASGHLYAKRYLAFLDLFEPIHQDYMVLLAETGRLDLDDVANKAAEVIRSGAYKSPFKYILVDDFQDISQSQYRLLKSLTDQNWRTRTFCVGDDWQSISRFSGSDLSIMLNYRKYFDPCAITFLNDALSSNEKITQFSSSFIMKNPAQYPKMLESKPSEDKAVTLIWYTELNDALYEALNYIKKQAPGAKVLVLSRYDKEYYRELDYSRFSSMSKEHQLNLYIEPVTEFLTISSSKDRQVDYVILYGLQSGAHGFPSMVEDDPILNLVLADRDGYPNAEERRVFYVAVTRARGKVYLLANKSKVSSFVTEIISEYQDLEVIGCPP